LITSSNAREVRYETAIESYLDYAIELRVQDVIPTSESEDLVIKEVVSPRPDERDIDGKRGVIGWNLSVKPGSRQTLGIGYDMVWPSDQDVR